MTSVHAPADPQLFEHAPPRKHVLLLSCMDQRLLDDTVAFMDSYNLANRYDQVVFAGAALGVLQLSSPSGSGTGSALWSDVFLHHLQVAIDVLKRPIRDIFILEHRDCGAYEHFHPTHHEPYTADVEGQQLERRHHCEQAFKLAARIREYCQQQQQVSVQAAADADCDAQRMHCRQRADAWHGIQIKCFLMDLKGRVEHLSEPASAAGKAGRRPRRRAGKASGKR